MRRSAVLEAHAGEQAAGGDGDDAPCVWSLSCELVHDGAGPLARLGKDGSRGERRAAPVGAAHVDRLERGRVAVIRRRSPGSSEAAAGDESVHRVMS